MGGALTYAAGWTWIFWFLCIASGICLATMALLLPETCRNIVGNGSIPAPSYLQIPIPTIMRHTGNAEAHSPTTITTNKWRIPNPFKSILILLRRDNTVVISACAVLYVVYPCINVSLATLFVPIYHLNQWEAGLIYLSFGVGGVVSAFISGRMLDRAWRDARIARRLSIDKAIGDDLDVFPVERARLSVIWLPMGLTTVLVVGFGWVLHFRKVCYLLSFQGLIIVL